MNSGSSAASNESSKVLSLRVSQSAYGTTIPRVWGKARVSSNLLWYGDFQGHEHKSKAGKGGGGGSGTSTYTYSASFALGLCAGPIASVSRVWIDDTSYEPSKLGFSLNKGALGQKPWSYLSSNYENKAISYSGIAYAACANYDLGDSYNSPQWTFEIVGERATSTDGDAPPADVIQDIWTDPVEGLGLPSDTLADLTDYRAWCEANDLSISLVADTQQEARQYVQQVLDATMAVAVPSQGVVKIVPIGDEAIGNWKPNVTPVYDIGEDDLLEAPVITRAQPRDANNKVTVEYYDRSKDYATVPVTASDLTHVNQYGAKTNSMTLHCITRGSVAATVAASTLNRDLYIRSTVELHVDQRFCLLEPMDLITLTFGPQNLDKYPLRVTSIEESDDGELTISAEEWPFGVATGTKITTQPTSGYKTDYNVAPGNVNMPVIFEPPVSLAGEPEVWLLTSGGSNWGGAQVWVSLDDATYSLAGTVSSAARHGTLSAAYPYASDPDNANTLAIDISVSGGQLVPVTQAVRDLYQSLCYVGTAAGGELLGYLGADLTGVGRYDLTNIRRGAYGSKITSHESGAQFARLDGSQFRYPYESGMIGKTLYIKILSYNKYGAALQSLADVSPVAYVVKGAPLGAVAGLVLESPFTGTTFAAKWNAYAGASYYNLELWSNNTLKKSLTTTNTRFSATIAELVSWGIGRTVELRVYAVAVNGQSTDAAVLIATKAQIAAPTVSVQDTVASMIVSLAASTDAAYKASRICISQTQGFDPAAATQIYDGPQTSASAVNLAKGTWYVRATQYDQFGPDALNWSSEVALAVSAKADGVQKIADVSTVTAAPGSNPPGGGAYWAAYDIKTGKMATWDITTGKYTFAVYADDITGKIADAQINQTLLDRISLVDAPASTAGSVAAQVAAEAALRATAITNEATLRQTANTGLAQQISTLTAGVAGGFDPGACWYFDNDAEGWTGSNLTAQGGWIQASTSGTSDGTYLSSGAISVSGAQYSVVRARVQRVTGSGSATLALYYSTASHGFTPLDKDSTVVTAGTGDVNVIEWDTSVLDAGGNDWLNSTITAIKIQDTTGSTWRFDWIAIGRKAPGASMAGLQTETLARMFADQAEASARTTLAAQVGTVQAGLTTEQTTRANADTALSSSISTVQASLSGGGNLLPNSGFDVDIAGWVVGGKQVSTDATPTIVRDLSAPAWLPTGMHSLGFVRPGVQTGIQDVNGPTISVEPGARYCLSGWVASHRSKCDLYISWLDASRAWIAETHTPDNAGAIGGTSLANWKRVSVFATAPANAVYGVVCLRQYGTGDSDANSWVVHPMLERAADAQTAPSPWAPSSNGVWEAVSQVTQTANATAGKIAASYGVTLSSNGYISGLKSYNDGSTSQFRVTADQVFIGASNMVRDEGFYSPSWWFHGAQTAWPSNCTSCDSTSGDGMPGRYLKITPGAYVEAVSQTIPADAGAAYRVRLRIYRSADFVGKLACCALFPSSAWGQPGPVGSNTIATSLGNVPCLSNTEGLGTLQTYTGIWTGNPSYSYLNACIFASVTAGFASVWLEVVRATGTDMIVDGSVTATQIAAGAVTTDKLQAKAVSADKIAVSSLSAISATLGTITAAAIELVSSSWNYIRTSSKWWGDGVDGFIMCASPTAGYFQEFRATCNSALILEQKGNGVGPGFRYYLQVRDPNGIDRIVIDPANATYTFKGAVYADSGMFAGSLSGATGTFAGALQAATGTFSGSLTANAINAVNRINIGSEQIVVPRSVIGTSITYAPSSLADGETINCTILAGYNIGGAGATRYTSSGQVLYTDPITSGTARINVNGSTVGSLSFSFLGQIGSPLTLSAIAVLKKGDVVSISIDGGVLTYPGGTLITGILINGWINITGCAR
ncbi:phage tail protein [Uliginosibacterium gangwonense]|uniref:phage tail protein n=1 Tax=Uliginosibacterium gangwonense TaxID=392736 RepID=UPI00036B5E02|nr:phage tail protein [Uliginosibacterium gangwonense]